MSSRNTTHRSVRLRECTWFASREGQRRAHARLTSAFSSFSRAEIHPACDKQKINRYRIIRDRSQQSRITGEASRINGTISGAAGAELCRRIFAPGYITTFLERDNVTPTAIASASALFKSTCAQSYDAARPRAPSPPPAPVHRRSL